MHLSSRNESIGLYKLKTGSLSQYTDGRRCILVTVSGDECKSQVLPRQNSDIWTALRNRTIVLIQTNLCDHYKVFKISKLHCKRNLASAAIL